MTEQVRWMRRALSQADEAAKAGEVPIGCVIVRSGELLSEAYNLRENLLDVSAHAEVLALREAAKKLGSWRLQDCDVYVTLEPCPMCASALQQAQVRKVYFAATDPKTGAVVSTDHFFDRPGLNHRVEYKGGLLAQEASSMLKAFFRARRERNKKLNQELGGRKARRDLMNREGALHKAKLLSRKTILPSLAEGPDTDPRDPLP